MLLTFDIGNTHTVVGCFNGSKLINHWRITSERIRTEDELGVLLQYFFSMENLKFDDVRGICISSVVPDLTEIYQYLSRRYFKKEPLVVDASLDLGMQVKYKNPASVGADRLCNAVAGKQKYGAPLLIIDFGTATTIDCIDANGDYSGGVIAPGIITSIESLHLKAAKLPRVGFSFPKNFIGQTTEESIQSGIFWGTVFLIEGLVDKIKHELGTESKVVATGGLAQKIIAHTTCIDTVDPYLSLEGMALIFERNQVKNKIT